jgi:hypothetical protein
MVRTLCARRTVRGRCLTLLLYCGESVYWKTKRRVSGFVETRCCLFLMMCVYRTVSFVATIVLFLA